MTGINANLLTVPCIVCFFFFVSLSISVSGNAGSVGGTVSGVPPEILDLVDSIDFDMAEAQVDLDGFISQSLGVGQSMN